MSPTLETTVGQWVAQRPNLARVFEKLGIDYCCGGKQPLEQACRAKNLDPATVLAMLDAGDGGPNTGTVDAAAMSLTELTDHIERTHHAYLKSELPRLAPLVDKIAARHSDKNPRLAQLANVYRGLRAEMEAHMVKEEQILFPLIRQIDRGAGNGGSACGDIANPIRVMEAEHQQAGDALAQMREMTDDFSTPAGGCNTYRAVMHSLAELEADMHRHVHKENNVLFPRALAAAARTEPISV